jgi:hypothetical protein
MKVYFTAKRNCNCDVQKQLQKGMCHEVQQRGLQRGGRGDQMGACGSASVLAFMRVTKAANSPGRPGRIPFSTVQLEYRIRDSGPPALPVEEVGTSRSALGTSRPDQATRELSVPPDVPTSRHSTAAGVHGLVLRLGDSLWSCQRGNIVKAEKALSRWFRNSQSRCT